MIVVPYEARHLMSLQIQESQRGLAPFVTESYARNLENGYAFTALDDDGEPLMVGGVLELWTNRGLVWSFVGANAGPHMTAIHKAVRRLLSLVPYRRLEADTPCGFKEGHRWLRMLGFTMEAECMQAYRVDGGDSSLYARVR